MLDAPKPSTEAEKTNRCWIVCRSCWLVWLKRFSHHLKPILHQILVRVNLLCYCPFRAWDSQLSCWSLYDNHILHNLNCCVKFKINTKPRVQSHSKNWHKFSKVHKTISILIDICLNTYKTHFWTLESKNMFYYQKRWHSLYTKNFSE